MKISILIIFFIASVFPKFLIAHQDHAEINSGSIYKAGALTQSDKPVNNESICFLNVFNEADRCCCSDTFCMGPGNRKSEMTCKNHCEDFSVEIIRYQNIKTEIIHSLYSKSNIIFIQKDFRTSNNSQIVRFYSVPAYISIQSLLI